MATVSRESLFPAKKFPLRAVSNFKIPKTRFFVAVEAYYTEPAAPEQNMGFAVAVSAGTGEKVFEGIIVVEDDNTEQCFFMKDGSFAEVERQEVDEAAGKVLQGTPLAPPHEIWSFVSAVRERGSWRLPD